MNDQRRSAVAEERVAIASISQVNVVVRKFRGCLAVFADGKVHHVAGVMPIGILEAVLFSIGIEVRARRLKVRTIALRILMEVDGVRTRREVMQLKSQPNALRAFPAFLQRNRAHALALGIFHLNHRLGRAGQRPENDRGRHCCNEQPFVFHGANYSQAAVLFANSSSQLFYLLL